MVLTLQRGVAGILFPFGLGSEMAGNLSRHTVASSLMTCPVLFPEFLGIAFLNLLPVSPIPPSGPVASIGGYEDITIVHDKPLLLLLKLGDA